MPPFSQLSIRLLQTSYIWADDAGQCVRVNEDTRKWYSVQSLVFATVFVMAAHMHCQLMARTVAMTKVGFFVVTADQQWM